MRDLGNYSREGFIEDMEIGLEAPSGWTITAKPPTRLRSMPPDPAQPFLVTWEVTPPADAAPGLAYELEAEAGRLHIPRGANQRAV
ncbi:MAG: hypothetical protein GEU78_14340 [Actinobacteria bacterium]|nr:hypothetical protein [Actinomycetota bacterium]